MTAIQTLAGIGFVLSVYAMYVKRRLATEGKYDPLCDISQKISCSRAFGSPKSNITGIPNPAIGILFYAIIYILNSYNNINIIFYLSILAVLASIYLASVAYIELRTYCVVCTATYIVNILLLYFTYIAIY